MPDSFHGSPAPSDRHRRPDKPKPPRPAPDDDAVDFNDDAPFDTNGSGALSFHVSRSGPLSGSSVLPWSELVRQNDADADVEPRPPAANGAHDECDPASDADLLREVLAQEPPPSKIIQDPSGGELKALPQCKSGDDAESAATDFHRRPVGFG